MSDDPTLWSATRLAAAIRSRSLSSRELLDAVLANIERLNPQVNAVITTDMASGPRRGDEGRRGSRAWGVAGSSARTALHGEGRDRNRGNALDRRCTRTGRPCSRRGCACGGTPLRRGRRVVRQDERPDLVRRFSDPQRAVRHDQQSVGPGSHHRRIIRRLGRRSRVRVHQLRTGNRHRRLGADPVQLLWHLRPQAQFRGRFPTGLPRSCRWRHDRCRHQRLRPLGTECGGPRTPLRCAGRAKLRRRDCLAAGRTAASSGRCVESAHRRVDRRPQGRGGHGGR